MQVAQTNPKLPVFDTARRSLGSVLANRGLALRLIWPWIAIILACTLAIVVGVLINSGGATPSPALITGASTVPGIAMFLAFVLSIPAVSVGWHRGIQIGERPNSPIRIDGAVWGYLGYSILITLIFGLLYAFSIGLAGAVAAFTIGLGDTPMSIERLAALAPFLSLAALPGFLLINRFVLVLPATAIGQSLSFGESFRRTRGNTLRLIFGAGLVTLPIVIVQGLGQLLVLATQNPVVAGGVGFVSLAVACYCAFASLSFTSLAYERLGRTEMMHAA